jgi:hypothetical protein
MIHLTVRLQQIIQEWVRREIIDFDPYEAEYSNPQLQVCPETVQSFSSRP